MAEANVWRLKGGKIHVERMDVPGYRRTLCGTILNLPANYKRLPPDNDATYKYVGTVNGQIIDKPNICKSCRRIGGK